MKAINKKNQDNRMGWILALEECENDKSGEAYFYEYEVCSEIRICGPFNYGVNDFLSSHLFQEKNQDGLYTYIVRVKNIKKRYEFNEGNYSKNGYHFDKGLLGELLALFSFYFQARFYHKATVTIDEVTNFRESRYEEEFNYRKVNKNFNFEIFTDQNRNWCYGLKDFLDLLRKTDQSYHQNLIRAFNWYAEAVKDIGIENQLFFIKMVSSIEALLSFIEIPKDSLNEKLNKLIDEKIFNSEESNKIKTWLNNRNISKKFVRFTEKYSEDVISTAENMPEHCRINKEEFKEYAKRIYDARSKYLHEGLPMHISNMLMEDAKFWDIDPNGNEYNDRKIIVEEMLLPRIRWFERIVNHCLKNFIKDLNNNPKQIDEMVYDLYGLTEDERGMVEGENL